MTQPSQVIHHVVTKVRRLTGGPGDGIDRARAWFSFRPYPPGTQPSFLGAIWFWHGGAGETRFPALHIIPLDDSATTPSLSYINLFFDPVLGGWTLLDDASGWRRIDFCFALPADTAGVRLRALIESAGGGSQQVDAGTLAPLHGVWRHQWNSPEPLPFEVQSSVPHGTGFVGGAPKSGVTWMQILLNQHEAVLASGEGDLLNHVQVRPYQQLNRWLPPDMQRQALGDMANFAFMQSIITVHRNHSGCTWVIDKSPGNAQYYRRLLAFLPSAKLIHCVRHPLDVVISRLHHEANIVKGGAPSREMEEHGNTIQALPALLAQRGKLLLDELLWKVVARILDEYASVQTEALEVLHSRPGKLLIVRYEDMLDDAQTCAMRVFEHLGVPATTVQVAACVRNASFGNLRDKRDGRAHPFFRAGSKRQFEALFTSADQARAMDYLRERLPKLAELRYALEPV